MNQQCNQYEEMFFLINLEIDGEISPEEQEILNHHRTSCPSCAALSEELYALSQAVQAADEIDIPDGFQQRVLAKIQETQTPKILIFPTIRKYGALAACAALCVGLFQSGLLSEMLSGADTSTAVATTAASSPMVMSTALEETETAVVNDRAVEVIPEATTESASINTVTEATSDSHGLTLPEQVAELLNVDHVTWLIISADEMPDPLPEGITEMVYCKNYSYALVAPESWEEIRLLLNFGPSLEPLEEGIPCVIILD